jgi:hypothetical protein
MMTKYTCWDYECEDDFEKEDIQAGDHYSAAQKYAWKIIGYIGEQHEYELAIAVMDTNNVVKQWNVRVIAELQFHFNETN